MATREATYLIAHTNKSGKNVGQAKITAKTSTEAAKKFADLYPGRQITSTGIAGTS